MKPFDFIGIDIAKEKFDVVLLQEKNHLHRTFMNKLEGFQACEKWIKEQAKGEPWICMEATGCYGEGLADYLYAQEIRVSVVNALQIKNFAKSLLSRNKTDKLDAKIIAAYCEHMKPALFTSRSEPQKVTRDLSQLIDTLKQQLVRLKNQSESTRTKIGEEALSSVTGMLEERIKELEKKLEEQIQEDKEMSEKSELLTSIEGIGKTTAYRVLAYLPQISHFESAKQLAAFIGVTPQQRESGQFKGKTRMTSYGHARLRKALYMPALTAKRRKTFEPFVRRLEKNEVSKKGIVGAMMRKLAHIIYGVLKSGKRFDSELACAPA